MFDKCLARESMLIIFNREHDYITCSFIETISVVGAMFIILASEVFYLYGILSLLIEGSTKPFSIPCIYTTNKNIFISTNYN